MQNKYTVKINSYGDKHYYKNGKLHRDDDLPAIEYTNGDKYYYKNGKRHRDGDLPAIEWSNGDRWYCKNDEIHRDDGLPAVEWVYGDKEYWIDGKELTEEEYYRKICKERNISNKQRMIYYLCGFEKFVESLFKNR